MGLVCQCRLENVNHLPCRSPARAGGRAEGKPATLIRKYKCICLGRGSLSRDMNHGNSLRTVGTTGMWKAEWGFSTPFCLGTNLRLQMMQFTETKGNVALGCCSVKVKWNRGALPPAVRIGDGEADQTSPVPQDRKQWSGSVSHGTSAQPSNGEGHGPELKGATPQLERQRWDPALALPWTAWEASGKPLPARKPQLTHLQHGELELKARQLPLG